ncbi:MAG TPA: hypothetical protein VL981_08085 [Candidatus Methylacidiphilales bacterium]|nr:hypothetical protein [Candidatus Methylacidiphilales bacterium]
MPLPARPSLEQLKKLAKDLVKNHQEKQPAALALIRRYLPELAGKTEEDVANYLFALHDAQSVIAREYGFSSWTELAKHVEALQKQPPAEPAPPPDVAAKLKIALQAREQNDYSQLCSVMSEQMKAFVTKERFESGNASMSAYFKSPYQLTYMGSVQRSGRPVYFWRLWIDGWDSDILVRMILNQSGLISGLLYSDPFDSAMNARK